MLYLEFKAFSWIIIIIIIIVFINIILLSFSL